jgi:two-component system LytT family sensor kinase
MAGRRCIPAFVACAVIAVLASSEIYMHRQTAGVPVPFWTAFLIEAPSWVIWAAFVPAIARLADRFRIDWPLRVTVLFAHAVALCVVLTTLALANPGLDRWFDPSAPVDDYLAGVWHYWVYSFPLATIVYAMILSSILAVDSARRGRELERVRADLAHAELSALRLQLTPHFIGNTLNTIAMLVRERGEVQALELIERLGDVLRHVLETSDGLEIDLDDELAFVRKYLAIEQARFGDKLNVEWIVDAGVGAAQIPPFVLQLLVENSLRHGLAPRGGGGSIRIGAHREGADLMLVVSDDGVGLPASAGSLGAGVGLANIRARLEHLYGATASLRVDAEPRGGVRVIVRIPFESEAHA